MVAAMQTGLSVTRPSETEDTLLEVRCARSPEEGFAPFRVKWEDISDPEAGPGLGSQLRAEKWGLRCERVAIDSVIESPKDLEKAAKAMDRRLAILRLIKKKGAVSQRQVLASLPGGRDLLRDSLLTLVESGEIETVKLPGGFEYRLPPK